MAKDLNRQIKIYIDNSDAMKKASELTDKISKLEIELQKLDAAGKKETAEYTKKENSLKQLNTSMTKYKNSVIDAERVLNNLSGATYGELLTVRKQIIKSMKDETRGTVEYTAKLKSLEAVKKEIAIADAEQRGQAGTQGSMWSRMANGFNKYFGIVTSVVASITGLSFAFRKLAEDVAKMDDVYSDVMKTTDMTRDQVVDLNESFKKLDTRTAREELNRLARDAGKLGLKGKQDILDFVEAGNEIDVALGDDLGEGAIKNIGKMTDIYAKSTQELEKMDLKGKMLAIGSAINELGMSSTANEGYLVDFAQRLGGVASQAGISIQNILGYASALDQSAQAVEMSATALQKFIMKLMGEPEKFAKMAGIEVSKFNKLLKEDTNEAIKLVLSSLANKGGFQQLIPIFKDMGLDGARAVGVLSALATNINKVNDAQEISNKAFLEGTSISKEYGIKNNNLQAKLEKNRKAFKDAALELGERLNPALLKSTNITTKIIKVMPRILDFFEKYGPILVKVAALIGVYTLAVKIATLAQAKWTIVDTLHYKILQAKAVLMATLRSGVLLFSVAINILTGNTIRAAEAWKLLGASMQANAIGLVITAVAALGYAIYIMTRNVKEQLTAAKALNDINKDVAKSTANERAELDLLLSVARNEKISKDERLKAIKRLNEISPQYLGNLSLENINTKEATKSVKAYTDALLANAKAKSIQTKVEELYADKNENSFEIEKYEKIIELHQRASDASDGYSTVGDDVLINKIKKLKAENAQIDENIKKYTSFYEQTYQSQNAALSKTEFSRKQDVAKNQDYLDKMEQQYADAYNSINENKKNVFYSESQKTVDLANLAILGKQIESQRKLTLEKKESLVLDQKESQFLAMSEKQLRGYIAAKKENADLAAKILNQKFPGDIEIPLTEAEQNKQLKNKKTAQDLTLETLETSHQQRMFAIKKNFSDRKIESESDYNSQLYSEDQAYYLLREKILEKFIKETNDKELKSNLQKSLTDLQNKRIEQEIKFRSELEKIILNANPEAKEKKEYENRLKLVGITERSVGALKLTIAAEEDEKKKVQLQDQLTALELLEKQHQDNLFKIRHASDTSKEKQFKDGFDKRKKQFEQEITEERIQIGNKSQLGILSGESLFDAEVALIQKRIDAVNKEIEARTAAGVKSEQLLIEQKQLEGELTATYISEFQRRAKLYSDFAIQIGETLGAAIMGNEDALKSSLKGIINMGLDLLKVQVQMAIAGATVQSLAMPDSLATFGAAGFARAAVIVALIEGVFATAKSVIGGVIDGGSSNSSASTTSTGERVVNQNAKGKYDVIGEEDGRTYRNVPYRGVATTGIVTQPVLVGEQGSELVVSHPDFMALQRHINYPMVVQAIQDSRSGRVLQRASGKYDGVDNSTDANQIVHSNSLSGETINNLTLAIQGLINKELAINYYEFEKAKETVDKARNGASKH